MRLEDGGAGGNLVVVKVMVDGSSTGADLDSFAFDLVLGDPTVARFVSGTAPAGRASAF